jgi:hypothetical protein
MYKFLLALSLIIPVSLTAAPAAAAPPPPPSTVVVHDGSFTVDFPGDICGTRANTTTFTVTMNQTHVTSMPGGGFQFHEVAVLTYVSDYDDPALPTLEGRTTQVSHFTLTDGEAFSGTIIFKNFLGDIRVFQRFHVTSVDSQAVVMFDVVRVTGCP